MASHSSKVTIEYSEIQWKAGWRSAEPCHEFSFMVFFELPHGWFHFVTTLSTNLIGTATKWYIELPQHSFVDFGSLETVFLTHFQLPICYETGTDLLTSLWQNTSTHISDNIHEWRRRRMIIKAPILDQLLTYWFTKYLFPPIAWDVAMGGAVNPSI